MTMTIQPPRPPVEALLVGAAGRSRIGAAIAELVGDVLQVDHGGGLADTDPGRDEQLGRAVEVATDAALAALADGLRPALDGMTEAEIDRLAEHRRRCELGWD